MKTFEEKVKDFIKEKYDINEDYLFEETSNFLKKKYGKKSISYRVDGCVLTFCQNKKVIEVIINMDTNFCFSGMGEGRTIKEAHLKAKNNFRKQIKNYLEDLKYEIYGDSGILEI